MAVGKPPLGYSGRYSCASSGLISELVTEQAVAVRSETVSGAQGSGVGQSVETRRARQNIHAGSPSGLREEVPVFFFYNSRWGCVTSLLVSAALTLLLLFLLGWI